MRVKSVTYFRPVKIALIHYRLLKNGGLETRLLKINAHCFQISQVISRTENNVLVSGSAKRK